MSNLGVLGEIDEPLLARALQHIDTGSRMNVSKENTDFAISNFTVSKMFTPMRDNMYIDNDRPQKMLISPT